MGNFMAEMSQQRPVGLVQINPLLLAKGVVRLGDIDGDPALLVAGDHSPAIRRIAEKAEAQRRPAFIGATLSL